MIPIDASKPLVKEKDGVKYSFRYVTEEIEEQFDALVKKYANKNLTVAQYKEYGRELIDLFLVGWEGKNLPEFPKEKPSRFFTVGSNLVQMAKFIDPLVSVLAGVGTDDLKN